VAHLKQTLSSQLKRTCEHAAIDTACHQRNTDPSKVRTVAELRRSARSGGEEGATVNRDGSLGTGYYGSRAGVVPFVLDVSGQMGRREDSGGAGINGSAARNRAQTSIENEGSPITGGFDNKLVVLTKLGFVRR
jgi:hypothetical protein